LAVVAVGAAVSARAPQAITRVAPTESTTWGYGGGPRQIRYSSLRQITKANVAQLQVAWTYDTGEPGALQTEPIVVDGVLYGYTPTHKAFALNAATGDPLWTFDSGTRGSGPNRGLMYWQDGHDRRVFAAVGNDIYALDASTGKPIPDFGVNGRLDLREGLGRDPATQGVRLTTPGVIYRDVMIVGGRVGESLPTSPGDVRAYNVRTGRLRWSFHTIPHPGEFGYDTWPPQAWTYSGGVNSWPGMALDETRGIVYVPIGSAATDFYGADRIGDDLFANSLVALDASTGRRLWHFQFVRHDLWDRDPPSPPSLVTVHQNGRTIDAVAQATKQGFLFLFDRTNGQPVFPIEYRHVPASDVPGEHASDLQPVPTRPKPFARQRLTEDLLSQRTPEVHTWALDQFKTFRSEGQFVPLSVGTPTVVFPGFDGGAEWGGQAFDPETGLYYVNANDLAWTGALAPNTGGRSGQALYLQYCASCHRDDRLGSPPTIPSLVGVGNRKTFRELVELLQQGAGRMPSFSTLDRATVNAILQYVTTGQDAPMSGRGRAGRGAPRGASGATSRVTSRGARAGAPASPLIDNSFRFTGYRRFLDPDGYPAVAPPWGTLSAIDLDTGEYAWQIPLGEYPELVAQGLKDTGSENYGGPIVTAGGLVFIGATNADRKFRAFDKLSGRLLWSVVMRGPGRATPATYAINGRQYVVVATGSTDRNDRSPLPAGASTAAYVAFALPQPAR
jgi:quinoprotein glucose dehydrogenase